jgi:NAD+ synthase (glutamine-hydrolysing)
MRLFRLALAQINPTVGDLEGNAAKAIEYAAKAAAQGADLVAFPELALTGYPPEDLLLKSQFLADAEKQLERVVAASKDIAIVIGTPHLEGSELYNAAAIAVGGELVGYYHKMYLPNYGVFDEERYFRPSHQCPVYVINGVLVGVNICEDVWYPIGPVSVQRAGGAELIVNINASPYYQGRGYERQQMLSTRASDNEILIAYVNTVGGQDELVFDGQTMVMDQHGALLARGPQFEEALLVMDLDADAVAHTRLHDPRPHRESPSIIAEVGVAEVHHVSNYRAQEPGQVIHGTICEPLDPLAEVYTALVTGTRDYVGKSGFGGAVIGLSGGIDSALTAAVAVDALGPENVTTVFMPSPYSSEQSRIDAQEVADNLGIPMHTIPISSALDTYLDALAPVFAGKEPDTTEENLQARIRGNILMALSNKFGWLVLTTGNKSEMATGYCTLYGDMAGGFAVIKDVPKTLVQRLSAHRNQVDGKTVIPESILTKPPSAELRPDQKDEDSLPPYADLDPILKGYVEDDLTIDEILSNGASPEHVALTVRLVDGSEYKRRQAPPGVKITPRAFGRDRRLPLVNRYRPTQNRP